MQTKWRYHTICKEKELSFSIFILYSLAEKWHKSPSMVYKILDFLIENESELFIIGEQQNVI